MAALPDDQGYGVDPESMQEMPMPGGIPPELLEQMPDTGQVDPMAGPADPMLGPVTEGDDEEGGDAVEVEKREKVEYGLLCAIERMATACDIGEGASNVQYAVQAGQAAASLAQAYSALTTAERKDETPETGSGSDSE